MKRFWLIIGIVVAIVWLNSALYTVDQAEFGYVTRFGDPTITHDGKDDAGLHMKMPWPVDSVTRVDRRLQVFDLPPTETLTRDRMGRTVDKTIAVDAFVCWRVPDAAAADRFIRTVGTPEQARRLLTPRLTGRLAAVISNLPLEDVIQVGDAGAVDARSERLRRQVLGLEKAGDDDPNAEPLPAAVLRDYGIELVEVRLRRVPFPGGGRAGVAGGNRGGGGGGGGGDPRGGEPGEKRSGSGRWPTTRARGTGSIRGSSARPGGTRPRRSPRPRPGGSGSRARRTPRPTASGTRPTRRTASSTPSSRSWPPTRRCSPRRGT